MAFEDYLRRVNLFGNKTHRPSFQFQFPDQEEQQPPSRELGFPDVYRSVMEQEPGPAQQKYRQFLDEEIPSRENFKPSKMNRLAAMLSGISEGMQGGDGYGAARKVLDDPYKRAIDDFKLRGDKYVKAAELEEKNVGNRVKTLWDTLRYNQDMNQQLETKRLNDARINNYQSQATARGKPKLINSFTEGTSGIRKGVFDDPNSPNGYKVIDLGKAGMSTPEQIDFAGKKAGAESTATLPGRIKVAQVQGVERRATQAARFKSIRELNEWKNNNRGYEFFPQPGGNVIAIDKSDPSGSFDTGIDSGRWDDYQKSEAAKKLKATPPGVNPTTRTTTTTVKGNERTSTTTTGSAGATKPSGKTVVMISPEPITINGHTGTEWVLSEEEAIEAEKNNWKRKQ